MKRSRELRDLSDDHHHALVLARAARNAVRAEASEAVDRVWRRVRAEFPARLEPHFRIEEEILLPALERIGESELVRRTRADHAALRATVAATPEEPRAALADLGRQLHDHVRFEEREMFPVAEARLAAADLAAVHRATQAWRREHGDVSL